MLELEVILDMACKNCSQPMGITLICEGEGLAQKNAKAFVKVPCPSCHKSNQIVFTPDEGMINEIFPEEEIIRYLVPNPSLN